MSTTNTTPIRSGIVAVTGASRGIGADIVIELARRGFTVACLSRSGTLPTLPEGAADLAGKLHPVRCDVTSEDSVKSALADAAALSPVGLTGLVNNAGIHLDGRSDRMPTSEFEQVLATNTTAVFVAAREAYPHLAKTGGMIINMGSFFDRLGVKRNAAYCASKAAVAAITRCLAVEWASVGIKAITIAPGYIETDLNRESLADGPLRTFLEKRIPTGGPSGPDAIARMTAALLEENIPFLTGETIYIDGAQGIAH